MAIKDWIIIGGVVSLVLERIIRWIFKLIRPEKDIDNLAMDLVKLHDKRGWDSTPLTYFYLYKGALKKKLRWNQHFVDYLEHKEQRINQELDRQERIINNNYAVIIEVESLLSNLQKQGKLPDELEGFLQEAQALVSSNKDVMKWRMEKITAIINKVFKKSKKEPEKEAG